jgi:restriction system protein
VNFVRPFFGSEEAPLMQIDDLIALPSLIVKSVIIPGPKCSEGQIVEAVALPWFEIVRFLTSDPAAAFQISPRQWEKMIAGYYEAAGFDEVILTPPSGDKGRDVIAVKRGIVTVRIFDQMKVKQPGRLVKADEVKSLLGVLAADHSATHAVFTTTSEFAPRLHTDKYIAPYLDGPLELVNGTKLLSRLQEIARRNDA